MTLRTVLVDDELLARDMLRTLLAEHSDIEIVATCKSAEEAIAFLQHNACDLLFLDIQMPRKDGFAVVEEIGLDRLPAIVFVTAYHEYAVRAFDVQAIDYLTKPTNPERLRLALTRVRERIASKVRLTEERLASLLTELREHSNPQATSLTRLLVKDGEREVILPVRQIEWVEAAAYYCSLHHRGKVYMHRQTMTDLERVLDSSRFVRVHRKAIVNLDFVAEVFREGRSGSSLRLNDGTSVPVSQSGIRQLDMAVSIDRGRQPIPVERG
jgi:two-component system LytT family response regulator